MATPLDPRRLLRRAARAGRALRALGLAPGDVAALSTPNRPEVLELALGALLSGVWLAHLDPGLPPDRRAALRARAGARLLIADAPVEHALTLDALAALAREQPADPFPDEGPPGGTLHLSSGTTGAPKPIQRTPAPTLGQELSRRAAYARAVGMDAGPHLVTGPLYHAAPLGFALAAALAGAPVAVMPRFDAAQTLRLLTALRASSTHLVPTMLRRCLALPGAERAAFDPAHLRCTLHGAAPIGREEKARLLDWWGPSLTEYWGSSEVGVITLADVGAWRARPGTVGRPLEPWTVTAEGDEGPLPPGQVGRLIATHGSGQRRFRYRGDPARTAAVQPVPGRFATGDLGWLDEEGFVYLAGRADDVILSGGVNVYPAAVEAALAAHPSVIEAAVVGLPDPEWGEIVAAALVTRGSLEAGELSDWCRHRLPAAARPRRLLRLEGLPRNAGGKVERVVLRALLQR